MTLKNIKMLFRCLCLVLAFCVFTVILLHLLSAIHSLEAPYILLTNPQQLGKKVGDIDILWNGKRKSCWVYTSKKLTFSDESGITPCLLIYPKIRLNPFPYHGLKITENSIGIFNDSPTECFPMGKWVYESSMTCPVYSVSDDMKGWNSKFEILKGKNEITYKVFPSKEANISIEFSVPLFFFEYLRDTEL